MADGDGTYRSFRQNTRERLLHEMLRSAKSTKSASPWKVLIMDELTVKVMSSSCKMADITDEGVSLVEDLNRRRQPLPALDAVYFIQPSRESVKKFVSDMSGKSPLYKKAYVYFSSTLPRDLLKAIKEDRALMSRISALREVNLEYLAIDMQGFVTDNDRALQQLFGEQKELDFVLDTVARRLTTVFASFREFPYIRYRAARSAAANSTAATTNSDLLPTKLAACVWDRLMKYKSSLPDFPQNETCDLLILDRAVDPIAPVIHEWTYEAMCHDLLSLEGSKYTYEITTSSGKREQKEVLLEEHDPIWVELRDLHIAEVSVKLDEKMKMFANKNKAAEIKLGGSGQNMTTRDMQKVVQALPQYRDQIEKLSLHIDIATALNSKIRTHCLSDVAELEQNLVYGDASSKELINFLSTAENISADCKLRLLMIYAATHPEKLDESKKQQWMKLARLSDGDMAAVSNLEYLGLSVSKKQSGGFALKFSKNKNLYRKERNQDEEVWKHSRFTPLLQELVEDMEKGKLSLEDYPYVKGPSEGTSGKSSSTGSSRLPTAPPNSRPAQSMRTSKPGSTWASRPRASDDGYSSDSVLKSALSDPKMITGKRIFVFVVSGITHSELRAAHKLSSQLKREVVLGSTCIDDPHQFVAKVKTLNDMDIMDF
ncbi:SNARE-interacting protein KEULE [Selaginella moellendorffii]|uniref:SNARE-interacting protein KEULE n=1 Tax=Selaginella moellendorffii TaxID=88036 RepID=UPI000D1CADF2|nr:SNARE-interacting protein KEULE [Selaginella moellendorffii]|eukprot:XP_024530401.1 SNARE-interacting protein KEULE [Selaginella moellendorffii]